MFKLQTQRTLKIVPLKKYCCILRQFCTQSGTNTPAVNPDTHRSLHVCVRVIIGCTLVLERLT